MSNTNTASVTPKALINPTTTGQSAKASEKATKSEKEKPTEKATKSKKEKPTEKASVVANAGTTPKDNTNNDIEPDSDVPFVPDDNGVQFDYGNQQSNGSGTTTDTAILPHWDEMGVAQQYSTLDFNATDYSSSQRLINVGDITDELGIYILHGLDYYTDEVRYAKGYVYRIRGILDGCAVAVKFGDSYYSYENVNYQPATLGQFMDDLNMSEYLEIDNIAYRGYRDEAYRYDSEYSGVDRNVIMNILSTCRGAGTRSAEEAENKYYTDKIEFGVQLNVGCTNLSLTINDNGYVTTNLLSSGKYFYVGKDKYEEIKNYIVNNCSESVQGKYVLNDGSGTDNEHTAPAYLP